MVQSTLQISGEEREKWIRRNRYYYTCLIQYLRFVIPPQSSILEIGCGTGYLLEQLHPSKGVGIDSSKEMINYARQHRGQFQYFQMDAEELQLTDTFDFVVISDTIGYFNDVQKVFEEVQKVCAPHTRIIISYTNFFWLPFLRFAEIIGLKMPQKRQNWLDISDIANLLTLANFDVVRQTKKIIFPRYLPLISWFLNRYVVNLPLFNFFGLVTFLVARSIRTPFKKAEDITVSVVIPTRNEKGNIEALVQRTPKMGKATEIIFVEGNSTDDTWDEIQRVCKLYQDKAPLKWIQQEGKGKGDAVRKGYSIATGDVLMILDADMTVPPEDLPKFFEAIASGKGEYINGTRLVYPMEKKP